MTSKNVVLDLYQKFVQPEVTGDANHIMEQTQRAYWYYVDYIKSEGAKIGFKRFVHIMSSFIGWQHHQIDTIMKDFWAYCAEKARAGGILLDKNRECVVLVRSVQGTRWGFPLGKTDENEPTTQCAEREVFEETGYWARASADKKITYKHKKSVHTLYLFENVPERFPFCPQTVNEIAEVKWFPVTDLPKYLKQHSLAERVQQMISQSSQEEPFYPIKRPQTADLLWTNPPVFV